MIITLCIVIRHPMVNLSVQTLLELFSQLVAAALLQDDNSFQVINFTGFLFYFLVHFRNDVVRKVVLLLEGVNQLQDLQELLRINHGMLHFFVFLIIILLYLYL